MPTVNIIPVIQLVLHSKGSTYTEFLWSDFHSQATLQCYLLEALVCVSCSSCLAYHSASSFLACVFSSSSAAASSASFLASISVCCCRHCLKGTGEERRGGEGRGGRERERGNNWHSNDGILLEHRPPPWITHISPHIYPLFYNTAMVFSQTDCLLLWISCHYVSCTHSIQCTCTTEYSYAESCYVCFWANVLPCNLCLHALKPHSKLL